MVLPVVAAGAIGSTVLGLLAIALIIHLLSKEELGLMTIAAVVIVYLVMK